MSERTSSNFPSETAKPLNWSRRLALLPIRFYRLTLSWLLGRQCRFRPTCSAYAWEAIERYGAVRGWWLALRRLARCHPFHPGGWDPVPPLPEDKRSPPPPPPLR